VIIARVVGNVVSSVKHPKHIGMKLMVVEAIDSTGAPLGSQTIAVDCAFAGVGDTVLVNIDGGAANMIYGDDAVTTPIDSVICGVIDSINI
jgi:microcompartment protein CcmK/EutM